LLAPRCLVLSWKDYSDREEKQKEEEEEEEHVSTSSSDSSTNVVEPPAEEGQEPPSSGSVRVERQQSRGMDARGLVQRRRRSRTEE
jgi:hypothetical protein